MNTFTQETTPTYASFWARFAAALLDGIVAFMLTFLLILTWSAVTTLNLQNPETSLQLNLAGLVLGWLYYAGMESSKYQATFGKQIMGVFVTDERGVRPSFAKATGRYLSKIISSAIFFIGYIMAGFTDKNQALHDIIAGTLVFRR
ncbi:RDD family protein [Pontibacter vulgaris]|uniref:RDD family protein n=1 Tax=Pontibacter vulgaris TaxID=2905679 RepID=UPI001FA7A590|nr:RDD family protein [Pontibacter vulgaris]